MNTALQIISIQYELVLALSNSPDLKQMLQQFLRICNARLNLNSSHIFLYQDADLQPCEIEAEGHYHLKHFLSLPNQREGVDWSTNEELAKAVIAFEKSDQSHKTLSCGGSTYESFKISDHGQLIVEYQYKLHVSLEQILAPIISRLSLSCSSVIRHQKLTLEISTREAAEEQIRFQASHDDLTGLYNRQEITLQLENLLKTSTRENKYGALICIDLKDFKSINDLLGHNTGDQVLRDVANRLYRSTPKHYAIARFSGDEFVVLMQDLNKSNYEKSIDHLIHCVSEQIDRPFVISGNNYSLSCTIGYDLFTYDEKSAAEIIMHADLALHEAKHQGRKHALAYNASMSDNLDKKINYAIRVKRAIEKQEFELHYQPQFNHLRQIIGAEALLRWNSPDNGYESPAIYIPIAEKSDLIIHISKWVLQQACNDIKLLENLGLPDSFKKLSINISAKHMASPNFVDDILSVVQARDIAPHHFAIEITEGIMMGDVEHSINVLSTLKSYGIDCSIDDFGTGYSSLTYLKQLPASLIKIDRSFVKDMDQDSNNRSIANMIIGLGENLGMSVIAEGVETQAEVDCLEQLGCHQYQGYFFCKPVPFDELQRIMGFTTVISPITPNQDKTHLPPRP